MNKLLIWDIYKTGFVATGFATFIDLHFNSSRPISRIFQENTYVDDMFKTTLISTGCALTWPIYLPITAALYVNKKLKD